MLPTPLYFSPLHHQHHFSPLFFIFVISPQAQTEESTSEVERKKSSSISLPS